MRRGRTRWALGTFGLALAASANMIWSPAPEASSGAHRADVVAFRSEFSDIAYDWGRLEVQGMRPAISDLQAGEGVPADMIAGEARAWSAAMDEIGGRLKALPSNAGLRSIRGALIAAAGLYAQAAERFAVAAEAPAGPDRDAAISRGIELAIRGANEFTAAKGTLDDLAADLGLKADYETSPS